MAVHRGRLSLRPEPRQVARAHQRKRPVSLRARIALGRVCLAGLAIVGPGMPQAQEAFREVSLTPEGAACPRYRLMVDDGERTECWLPGLKLAAADERPAGDVPRAEAVPAAQAGSPNEKKPRWLL